MSYCDWAKTSTENLRYHDTEWGEPTHDDRTLFEYLVLEAMQCGLSWDLIIKKRKIFRECFADFNPAKVAKFTEEDITKILQTDGMIKNCRKIAATINNAKCFLETQKSHGSFDNYLWQFSGYKTIIYTDRVDGFVPAKNTLSEKIAKDLKARGFKFLGPVVVYSYLQACGLINDHDKNCPRFKEINANFLTNEEADK